MKKHILPAVVGMIALVLLAGGINPGVVRFLLDKVSLPAMAGLHRLTAPVPLPVAEPAALGIAAILVFTFLTSLISASALRHWLKGAARAALVLGGLLALLWGPPLVQSVEDAPAPENEQLEWLCGELIDALNASPLAFPTPGESLRLAPAVAGMPGCVVKAVRYPEWMEAAEICGMFVPLTGEALVDATAPAPLIPFTAVHELTHLAGVADEGAANIAAWERCLAGGGAFADSARLWALRYAMGLLSERDPEALWQLDTRMEDPLSRTFRECGGGTGPSPSRRSRLPLSRGDYAALTGFLAVDATKNE